MRFSRSIKLSACALLVAFVTAVCSSGYITPKSLAATEQESQAQTATSAAFVPSPTPSNPLPTYTTQPATATPLVLPSATGQETALPLSPYIYTAQSGDTLAALAVRFGVSADQIASPQDIPQGLINAGQIFTIPNVLGPTSPSDHLLPDSEIIYSPSAIGFDAETYEAAFGGYLATYREPSSTVILSGTQVVDRVATENSVNPRLLLSVLQYQSDWVLGEPQDATNLTYPIGYNNAHQQGLFLQLTWAVNQLSNGYYGWREGRLTELTFPNGQTLRIAASLNAGTVAIQYLFSKLYNYDDWLKAIDKNSGMPFTHSAMFPDPWVRAAQTEPLFPPSLSQPALSLPFELNAPWAFTSGPHGAWERDGALAALDFAPGSVLPGCVESALWVTAAAPGRIVRSGTGLLVVDLDSDGNEQTGWVVIYLHLTDKDQWHVGDMVERGQRLGHPSCEGGNATATHLHIARKYNGEWISAAGALPFVLSGWVTQFGGVPYKGTMVRGDLTITACTCSNADTSIKRTADDPY